jgi:hypothetical protein
MTRAVATFTVRVDRRSVRVRVLPTVQDVHRACMEGSRRCDGRIVHAYFDPFRNPLNLGVIVLPGEKLSLELIAHEATHAGFHCERLFADVLGDDARNMIVGDNAEERIAAFAGHLCQRIVRNLIRLRLL